MTDNEKPENCQPYDHPVPLRTLASLKSVSIMNALSGFGTKSEGERALLPGLTSHESLFNNLFHSENTINRAIQTAGLEYYGNMQNQSNILQKTVSAITDNSVSQIIESLREKSGVNLINMASELYSKNGFGTESLFEKYHAKHAERIRNIMRISDPLSGMIAENFFSDNLMKQSLKGLFNSDWERLSQQSLAAVSLREQEQALSAINLLFAGTPDSFTYLSDDIIDALDDNPEDNVEDVREQVRSAKRLSDYPLRIRKFLIWFFLFLILPTANEVKNEMIMEYLKQKCFGDFMCESKKEKTKILTADRPDELVYNDLNRIRVVRRDNVRLRTGPSMQAETIEVLPVNQPLVVINRDNRLWLLVRTELNGEEIEGWINRSYTQVLIK
ncbi:SH3 domain-containing protein [Vibrio sp.]|uniref:SH3 domain-containing protein n=1 Tax=Vibrio sp. TaxID=678 RepID=UPI003AA7D770